MRDHPWFRPVRFGFTAAATLLAVPPLLSQSPSARTAAADQAWNTVTALSRSANDTKLTAVGIVAASREEGARIKNERAQRAQQFRATAQTAKDFHTQNPSHPKAGEARKLEALASLQGITPTDRNYERTALATAAAFRANKANPVADRIAVAHAVESREISRKTLGRPWFANPVLAEMMLDRLQLEFGHQPDIWASRLSLAEHTYCDASRDAAYRVVQSPYAPNSTRAAARKILERYALVRKPLDFPLTPTQGRSTTLAEIAGKTTIVCFWDGTKHPEGPPGLHDYKKNAQPNTKWVYISVGSPGALPKGRKANAAPPGTTCVEPLGWKSAVVARLQITQLTDYTEDAHTFTVATPGVVRVRGTGSDGGDMYLNAFAPDGAPLQSGIPEMEFPVTPGTYTVRVTAQREIGYSVVGQLFPYAPAPRRWIVSLPNERSSGTF